MRALYTCGGESGLHLSLFFFLSAHLTPRQLYLAGIIKMLFSEEGGRGKSRNLLRTGSVRLRKAEQPAGRSIIIFQEFQRPLIVLIVLIASMG